MKKHPQSLLYNIAASMWGLLMFNLGKCSLFLAPSLANCFWSGWLEKPASIVKRWCKPGSNTTQCLKRSHKSTMIHWQTWDFQHSDQSTVLFFHFSLVLMAVSLKPWREGLHLFIGPHLCNLSLTHLPESSVKNPFDSTVQNHKPFTAIHRPYMLGTTRHVLVTILC